MSRRRCAPCCEGDDPGGPGGDCETIPYILGGGGVVGVGGPCTTVVNVHYNVTPGQGAIPDLYRVDTIETVCPDRTVVTIIYYRIASITATRETHYPDGSSVPPADWPVCTPGGDPGSGELTICAVGCDGEPLPGAFITAWSVDPSGPFSSTPLDPNGGDPIPVGTGEDGCGVLNYPLGLDPGATVNVTVSYPPEYKPTTVAATLAELLADGQVALDVADSYTCCDLGFRKGPINPGGLPAKPRGKTLLFVTSGSGVDPITGETETWEIEVDCDGEACAHSDELATTGGAPTVVMCLAGPSSDTDWDHWEPPVLDSGKVPALVRIWYDGTDWHARIKVYYTVARPPRVDLGGCNQDPSQNGADFFAWFRSDAACSDAADPKLSIADDPALTKPFGIDSGDGKPWYAGHTEVITVDSTSYTVGTNNPVDVTFQFPSVTLRFHSGNVTLKIIDSLTLWEPVS